MLVKIPPIKAQGSVTDPNVRIKERFSTMKTGFLSSREPPCAFEKISWTMVTFNFHELIWWFSVWIFRTFSKRVTEMDVLCSYHNYFFHFHIFSFQVNDFITTEFNESVLKRFWTSNLKIKIQLWQAKFIYSYLHPESDSRSKIWNLSLITLPSGIETL